MEVVKWLGVGVFNEPSAFEEALMFD